MCLILGAMTVLRFWASLGGALALVGVAAAAAPTGIEVDVLADLNRFRADPPAYVSVLRRYRARLEGKLLLGSEKGEIDIRTTEGVVPVDEAIREIRTAQPLSQLVHSDLLERVAADHVFAQSRSGATGHYTDGYGPGDRMFLRGGDYRVSEVITYGHHSAAGVIPQLLIDDGVPDRGHRVRLLRAEYRYAGVACGAHPVYRTMCVILMSATPDGSAPPLPSSAKPAAKPR